MKKRKTRVKRKRFEKKVVKLLLGAEISVLKIRGVRFPLGDLAGPLKKKLSGGGKKMRLAGNFAGKCR